MMYDRTSRPPAALEAELAALHRRVADLERALTGSVLHRDVGAGIGAHVKRVNTLGLSAGWNDIPFGTEVDDPRNWHDNSTNSERITVDLSGWFAYKFLAEVDGGPTRCIHAVGLNGAASSTAVQIDRSEIDASAINDPIESLSGIVWMDAGDYLTTAIYVSGGTSPSVDTSPIEPYFKVVRL